MGKRKNSTMKPLVVDSYARSDPKEQDIVAQPPKDRASGKREIINVDVTQQDNSFHKIQTAAYIRLSVENGGHGREDTLETQIDLVHEYIHRQPEMELYDTYVDNGISGQTFERPQFDRMMEDVSRGRVQCIVVKDLSRFGRNYLETGTYVEKIFPLLGVRLVSVNDNFDSTRPGDVDGLVFPMKNLINEMYAKDIGRKIKASYDTRDKEGKFLGSRPPYGYLIKKEGGNRILVPDEKTAGYVRVIFYWHRSGIMMEEISKRLELAGIPAPGQRDLGTESSSDDVKPDKWKDRALRAIVSNPTYAGDTVNRRRTEKGDNPREEWHVIPDTHEALVSHEDCEKSGGIYEQAKRKEKNQEKTRPLFYRKIYCGVCGRTFHENNGKYKDKTLRIAYHCSNKDCINSRGTVNEEVFKILIMDQFRILVRATCDYRKLAKDLMSEDPTKGKAGSIKVKLANARAHLKRIEERVLKTYEDYVEGKIGKKDYIRIKEELAAEKKEAEGIISALEKEQFELKKRTENFLRITEDFEGYLDLEGFPEEIIYRLVEKIEYFPDGGIKLTLKCADVYEEMLEFLDAEKDQSTAGENSPEDSAAS